MSIGSSTGLDSDNNSPNQVRGEKQMKKQLWTSVVLLIIIAAIVVACASAAQPTDAQATQAPAVKPTEPVAGASSDTALLFLGNKNIAPVVYLEGTTPTGVAVDIVHALAKHLSQPVEIKAMNWSEAQALVARGDADALIQINPTEERKKIYDFSDPLLESHFSIFTRTEKMGISDLSSLRGLRVGVESGGLPQQLLEKDPQVNVIIIPNFSEGFRQLNEGSVDAVVVDYRVGSYALAQNNIRNIKVTGEPVASTSSSIAVKKGNKKLLNEINTALHIIRSDGTYQKIIDNWQPTEAVFETQGQITERNYLVTILVLLILFLVAGIGIVTLKKELTKRKAAEEALHEVSLYTRNLIEASLDPLVTISPEGKITDVNEETVKVTGVSRDILIGSDFSGYFTEPDKAAAGYRKVLAEGYVRDYPLTLRHTSGRTIDVQYNASVYRNAKGEQQGVFAAARDITERKRAEEALHEVSLYTRNLIEASLDPLVTISPEGKITDVNEETVKVTGVSRDNLIGSDFSGYFTEPDKAAAGYRKVLAEGYVRDYPLTLRHTSGRTIDVLYNASVYRNAKGEQQGVFAAARDITERKRAEEALRAKNTDLEAAYERITANEEELRENYDELSKSQQVLRETQEELVRKEKLAVLGNLSGGVGHELRNPLGAIKNAAYFLNMALENPDAEVKETIDIINKEVARSEDIISSLLDFARPKVPMQRTVSVNTVLKEAISRYNIPKNVTVINNSDQNIQNILADPDKLLQVFGNLITNAYQAMPEGGTLTIASENTGPDKVSVTVIDTGTGITEENMKKMFEPLFTTKARGIGLGLVVSKIIVEAHGGRIDVQSVPGKGAVFTVILPVSGKGDV